MIKVTNINKKFDREVLKDISFEIEQGEVVFITGQSGIGKTTLLHIMMGLIPADSGEVSGIPSKMSCVFQEDRLLEEMSVCNNLKMVTDIPIEILQKECQKIFKEDIFKEKVKNLSGGMKRRVAVLRAMLADAEIVFMDEPFSGVDAENRKLVVDYILQNKQQKTLMIVSHDKEEMLMFRTYKHIHIG